MKKLLFILAAFSLNINAQTSIIKNSIYQKHGVTINSYNDLRTTSTATCPISAITMAGQDSLGNSVTNGLNILNNSSYFFIYATVASGTPNSPCISTMYSNFYTDLATYGTETLYEGGNNIGCVGPSGCVFPIGNGTSNNTIWSVSYTLLDPTQKHDFVFCRSGSITTSTITLIDCWTGNILPSTPASMLFSNTTTTITPQGCDTITIPANTDVGTATFSITPSSGASGLIDYKNGEASISPRSLTPGTYTVSYSFTPPIADGCAVVNGNFTFTILPVTSVNSVTICAGTTTTLTASGATTYSWMPTIGLSTNIGASVIANPTTTTIYTVTGSNTSYTTIATSTVTVNQYDSLKGIVTIGTSSVTTGQMFLNKKQSGTTAIDTTTVVASIINGAYSYSSLPLGNYYLKAVANTVSYPNAIPTYYSSNANNYIWDSAIVTTCTGINDTNYNISIIVITPQTGTGVINGNVSAESSYGTRLAGGYNSIMGALKSIDVKLGKKPAGGCTNRTSTDASGNYSFTNIDTGTYVVYVDIPNFTDTIVNLTITPTNSVYTNVNYCVDSVMVHYCGALLAGIKQMVGINEQVSVYPNPNNGTFTIKLNEYENTTVEVYNTIGQKVLSQTLQTNLTQLTLVGFNNGIYQLRALKNNITVYQTKVVKQE